MERGIMMYLNLYMIENQIHVKEYFQEIGKYVGE